LPADLSRASLLKRGMICIKGGWKQLNGQRVGSRDKLISEYAYNQR
jgi:hypothetical protein